MAEKEQTAIPIEGADKQTITGKGYELNVPAPFTEGHELRQVEADQLNQVYAENIRNNITGKIKRHYEQHNEYPSAEQVQQWVDEYVPTYDFGRQGSGGPKMSPVERQALSLARDAVKKKIRQREDLDLNSYSKEDIEGFAKQAIEQYPELTERAKQIVEAKQGASSDLQLDV
jgi:hypothetical protein